MLGRGRTGGIGMRVAGPGVHIQAIQHVYESDASTWLHWHRLRARSLRDFDAECFAAAMQNILKPIAPRQIQARVECRGANRRGLPSTLRRTYRAYHRYANVICPLEGQLTDAELDVNL